MDKERARIEAMRARAQARTARFMDSRLRTMGIDKEYLDRQIYEKQETMRLEREADMQEAESIRQTVASMEQQENVKNAAKARELQELRATLDEQAQLPKNNALASNGEIDLTRCGASSVQVFSGEDNGYNDRRKAQQEELKQWTSHQMEEKAESVREERENAMNYDKVVLEQNAISCHQAQQDEYRRSELKRAVQAENAARAEEERRMRRLEEKQLAETHRAHVGSQHSNPFLSEDTDYAKSAISDHRVRPDHFKGFSNDQVQLLVKGNADVLAEKMAAKKEAEMKEAEWNEYQEDLLRAAEELDRQKDEEKREQIRQQNEELQAQREELKKKQEQMKRDRFGAIGQGFFQGFGTSCR